MIEQTYWLSRLRSNQGTWSTIPSHDLGSFTCCSGSQYQFLRIAKEMLSLFDPYFKFETLRTFSLFLGTRLLAITLTFGEVYVIATKQNIFLQNSWLLPFLVFSDFDLYRFQLSLVPSIPQNILRLYFGIV